MKPKGPGDAAGQAGDARPAQDGQDRGFDLWLRRRLGQMFDRVASEPLPDGLVDLLRRNGKKGEAS